jgi:hypothetical protein
MNDSLGFPRIIAPFACVSCQSYSRCDARGALDFLDQSEEAAKTEAWRQRFVAPAILAYLRNPDHSTENVGRAITTDD